ncbi:MAG: (deoxy)nucleoside triphosphate pyrophosphohydrolase [Terracidiphilus sp.]
MDDLQADSTRRPPAPALRFVAAALIVRGREVLIGQRRADQPMGALWEFPGGKIEPGETPQQALARELSEELGIRAEIGPAVTRIRHHYRRGGAVDLQFFTVREFAGEIDNQIYQQVRWVKFEDLPGYEFLAADRGLIKDLAAGKLL